MDDVLDFGEKKCPICGKIFIPHGEDWVFKRRLSNKRMEYLCSYGCTNKFDLQHPKKMAVEQREEIVKLIRKGWKTSDIVRTLGVERSKVRYWQERIAKEEEGGEE